MAKGNLFRKFRIALLLYVLLFVATGAWLSRAATTDWDDTLYVTVYPMNGDGSAGVEQYLAELGEAAFEPIERFMKRESGRYGRPLGLPVDITVGPVLADDAPTLDGEPGWMDVAVWSLRARWWAWRATRDDGLPTPDIRLFLRYFEGGDGIMLDPSVGLQKGLIGFVNAFADQEMKGSNNVVITHELLHTLGATDKYDPATTQPVFPLGFAEPDRDPLYPQSRAEIMAGRIPVSAQDAVIPRSLAETVIGPVTAAEIRLRQESR